MNFKSTIKTTACIVLFSSIIFFMGSCGTSKKTAEPSFDASMPVVPAEHFALVQNNFSQEKNLVSKVNFTLVVNGKSLSTNGTLKMRKDDVIQLSLVDPVLGMMELGRLEFTPTKVLLVDRMNKQYIDVPYSELDFLKKANVDFNSLQSLFWNEVFEPGNPSPKASSFKYRSTDNSLVSMNYTDKMLAYSFETERATGKLRKSTIISTDRGNYLLEFDYSDFTDFEKGRFPKNLVLTFSDGIQQMSLSFNLGSIRNSSEWVTRTTVSSKYKKADVETIFKKLVK